MTNNNLKRKNREESDLFYTLDNDYIYIGDNLSVMNSNNFKNTIGNRVDCIYIDPPYNTKRKFSYKDKMDRPAWLLFMEERLSVARNTLKETGIIFLSIDDNEYAYLKVLCDKVFGDENFIGTFITNQSQRSNARHINIVHEYILCYAKKKKKAKEFKIKRILIPEQKLMIETLCSEVKRVFCSEGRITAHKLLAEKIKQICLNENITWLKNYSSIDENGDIYFAKDLSTPGTPRVVSIPEINLFLEPLPTRGWSSDAKFKSLFYQNNLVFKNGRPYEKHLLVNSEDSAPSVLNYYSRQGTKDLNNLGLRNLFDTPKPVEMIKYLIRISTPMNGVVLDFFAGSGTTAQAVYETNIEDNALRSYVLIQIDEKMEKSSLAYKTCIKLGIKPVISEAMLYRIDTFLKYSNINGRKYILERGCEIDAK